MRATTQTGRVRALGWAVLMLGMIAGCGGEPAAAETSPTASSASDGTTTAAGSSASGLDTAAADDTTGIAFLGPEPDLGGPFECDILAQDCPAGEKCTAWSSKGWSYDSTRCIPIAEDPAGANEPCHVEGDPLSGIDDCELGAMCWDIDFDTTEGTCLAFCLGSADWMGTDFHCDDPYEWCALVDELPFCLPLCDPLAQDCRSGETCIAFKEGWTCVPDASGVKGGYGDRCDFLNECDPGLVCVSASAVPPCEVPGDCCTEVCDLYDPAGDLQCAGAAEGQTCQPWYDEHDDPPTLVSHVGVCAVPSR